MHSLRINTILVFLMVIFMESINQTRAKPLQNGGGPAAELWQPGDGRSRERWLACWGLQCEVWNKSQTLSSQLLTQVASQQGVLNKETTSARPESVTHPDISPDSMEGMDILLYPEQAHSLMQSLRQSDPNNPDRERRQIMTSPQQIWPLPIMYKFDGEHSEAEQSLIKAAIDKWEQHTCLRFLEVNTDAKVTGSHLMFTKALMACASFVGRLDLPDDSPQMVSLGQHCFAQPGTAIHEIGHALGLWHEHQSPSRDDHITVHQDNIGLWVTSNFLKAPSDSVSEYGLPYDYNSVMHYTGRIGSIDGDYTITTNDALFQKNIGQRVALSFLDAKLINKVYCQDECRGKPLRQKCLKGGYQDPNDCSRCKCPDGISGTFCDRLQPAFPAGKCGGVFEVEPGQTLDISGPEYGTNMYYDDFTECNWLIMAPHKNYLRLEFVGSFSIYNDGGDTCKHWLELQTAKDFSKPGPRFCGSERPGAVLQSEGNEALVTLRSPSSSGESSNGRGFKLRITSYVRERGIERDERGGSDSEPDRQATPKPAAIPPTIRSTPKRPATSGEVELSWSDWGQCEKQCQCGGCSHRRRHTLCNGRRCEGERAKEEVEECSRPCHSGDKELIYVGKFHYRTCAECCGGYVRSGNECVKA